MDNLQTYALCQDKDQIQSLGHQLVFNITFPVGIIFYNIVFNI